MSAPDRIWLQVGDDSDGIECSYDGALNAGADISWCAEQIFDCDIEYIRKAALPVEEIRECLDDRYGPETAALFKTEYRLLERTLAVLEGNDE